MADLRLGPPGWWWPARVEHLWCADAPGQHGGNSSSLTTQTHGKCDTRLAGTYNERYFARYMVLCQTTFENNITRWHDRRPRTGYSKQQSRHVSTDKLINRLSLLDQRIGWLFEESETRQHNGAHIGGNPSNSSHCPPPCARMTAAQSARLTVVVVSQQLARRLTSQC